MRTLVLAAALVCLPLAGCTAPTDGTGPDGPIPFDTIDQGQQSGVEDRRTVVVRTEQAWEALWDEHASRSEPAPDRPNVDFDQRMVVAVFKGQSSNGCHGANITAIEGVDGEIIVHGEWIVPSPAMFCTEVVTYPFHIVELTASDVEVRFDMQERQLEPRE